MDFGFVSVICILHSAWKLLKDYCPLHLHDSVNLDFQHWEKRNPKVKKTFKSWWWNVNLSTVGNFGTLFWFNLFKEKGLVLSLNKFYKYLFYLIFFFFRSYNIYTLCLDVPQITPEISSKILTKKRSRNTVLDLWQNV